MKYKQLASIKGHIVSIQQFSKHFRVMLNGIAVCTGSLEQCKEVYNETVDSINEAVIADNRLNDLNDKVISINELTN